MKAIGVILTLLFWFKIFNRFVEIYIFIDKLLIKYLVLMNHCIYYDRNICI